MVSSRALERGLPRRQPNQPFCRGQKISDKSEKSHLLVGDRAVLGQQATFGDEAPLRAPRRLSAPPPRARANRRFEIGPRPSPRHVAGPGATLSCPSPAEAAGASTSRAPLPQVPVVRFPR